MAVEAALRPVHLVAAELGSDRAPEIMRGLHESRRTVFTHALGPDAFFPARDEDDRERLRLELSLVMEAARDVLADDGIVLLVDGRASLVVPEMVRLLLDDQGLGWEEAWANVRGCS